MSLFGARNGAGTTPVKEAGAARHSKSDRAKEERAARPVRCGEQNEGHVFAARTVTSVHSFLLFPVRAQPHLFQ
jgi:hypothetical protein